MIQDQPLYSDTGGQFIQVKLTKMVYIGALIKVQSIQDSGLFRIQFIHISLCILIHPYGIYLYIYYTLS